MKDLIICFILFIMVYLFYRIFVYRRKNVFKKFPDGKEMKYLKYKYNVKVNDSNVKKIANSIFLTNSFILSATVYVVSLFNNMYLEILFGFITLISLILIMYYILGKIYGKER